MPKNMIVRLGVDASDFTKKMQQAGASAENTGKRIRKSMSMDGLGNEVAGIMGWGASSTGVSSINAGNVDAARSQLASLQSYRDQLASAGFDDYQFGLVSERIKALEYDLNEYSQSLNRTASAERRAAAEADELGDEARQSETFLSRAGRALRSMGSSALQLNPIPNMIRRIGDSAGGSNLKMERMLRTIRNVSVVSFAFRIARSLFGEFESVVRNYISQDAQLQGQIDGLKSSLGQSLAPAIRLVTNALSAAMPYVVGISNGVSQLMAALAGPGWSVAAAGAGKTAAAVNSAANAQKEMSRQLLSFDQINKLGSQNASGSDSGASSTSYIEGKTPAWMERFQQSFSDLFNSSEFQSANIGGKIGQVLQTGLDWVGAEGMNFDWRGVGAKLRENFDGFIGAGWVESLFHGVGVALGGFADTVIGFLGPQWQELKTAYQNEGWQGAVVYVLGMTAALAGNGLSGLFEKVLAPVFSGLGDYFRSHGYDSVAGFFEGCAQWMINAGQWIREHITDPIVNWVKDLLGIHSPSTVFADIGENCMDGLGGGFTRGISGVLQKFTDLKDRILSIADTMRQAFSFEWQMPELRLPHLQVHWDPVDNIVAKFFGVNAIPRLDVQWFAKGGILDGAQIFGRMGSTLLGGGERGREAILPLDTNTGWMDVLANRISQSLSSDGGDVNATINLILDGDVLTSYVVRRLRSRARAGTSGI